MTLYNCIVHDNINTSFVQTHSEIDSLLQLTHTIKIKNASITNNTNHITGVSLLSFSHGLAKLKGPITIKGNHYYETIITLYFATLQFHERIDISENTAYILINTLENSYFVLQEDVSIEVFNNTLHSGVRKTDWIDNLGFIGFNDNAKICLIQLYSQRGNLDAEFVQNKSNINYKMVLSNNRFSQPLHLAKFDLGLKHSCSWLANMAFQSTLSHQVMDAFIEYNLAPSTKADVYRIPSKICYCFPNNTYNCTKRDVGSIFPGQLLKLSLTIPSLNFDSSLINKNHKYVMLSARTQSLPEHGCTIENASEIFQLHTNNGCNEYKYTIKNNVKALNECELYLGTQHHDTEILYVKLKPCPAGFVLDNGMCICDPLLKSEPLLLSSCNLDNGTILRPENSWVEAKTDNVEYSHTYLVSLHCPLKFCLPHPSYHNLSSPDSQCQLNRAGILCTKCRKGLSVVFGSRHCKPCTNYYLLIIIPFITITFLLLIFIFMFNLTVANGAITILIFYMDIVGINVLNYFPQCISILCIFIPSDEIGLCFYNGMTTYAKMWLYLCYPLYIIFLAVLLILASRYSVIFQRLTARRALSVLATLFLLSFTGLLRTTSLVLFYFKTIIFMPGKHTSLVWGVDASVELYGFKFILLCIVCSILFLILLIFSALLLFTKELLQFKIINRIKPLLDVYLGPYKHEFPYWTGLQLLMRTAIFGLTALDYDMSLMISTILLSVLLYIQGIVQPYKSKFHNFQQSLVLLDIIVINIISLYNRDNNSQVFKVVSILIYTGSFYFIIAYIIFHCIMHTFGKSINRGKIMLVACFTRWKQRMTSEKKMTEMMRITSVRRKVADVTYNFQEFQEPLIGLD